MLFRSTEIDEVVQNAKDEIQIEINDVNTGLGSLSDYVDNEFKNGLVSLNDSKIIRERMDIITKELSDITAQYEVMKTSPALSSSDKQKLTTLKVVVDLSHTELDNLINVALVDYIFTEAEIISVKNKINEYQTNLNLYSAFAQECNAKIAGNLAQGAVDSQTQEDIFNKLTDNGTIQGIYMKDGELYVNGQYINARNLTVIDDTGKTTFKIDDKGKVKFVVTDFTLESGGTTNVPTVDDVYNKDEVDNKLDEVNSRNMYKVEIVSSNGAIFKNGDIKTTLSAVLYNWDLDVTDTFPSSSFKWKRISNDTQGDSIWNEDHLFGSKTVEITSEDVQSRATFQVDVIDSITGFSILG